MATEVVDNALRFQTFFDSLETQKTLLTTCTEQWRKLSTHFSTLEQSLLQKTQTLDSKIETLDSESKQTLESIQQRENSIPEEESAAITRIEEQKQAGLSEFEKPVAPNAELVELLKSCCRKMDSSGLLKVIMTRRKEALTLRTQIAAAMQQAVDPPRLVLEAVNDFIVSLKLAKAGFSDRRWACGMLLSALCGDEKKVGPVAGKISERAAVVAEAWKEKIVEAEGGGVGHVEATMFLQMVVGFGLKSKFDDEFLRKLVLDYPSRRDMPKLAAALGLGEKMGDIIDELVKNGKEIEAVYFACECALTDKFSPVTLLKNYLKDSKKNASTILKNGHYNIAATEEANTSELNSLKNIIRCVEDHKLESEFPLEQVKRRATQLEKLKVDRKKSAAANKRARGASSSGPSGYRPAKAGRVSSHSYPAYRNPVAAYTASYNYPGQNVYDAPPATSYASPYAAHARSSAALAPTYTYPPEDIGVPGVRAGGSSYGAQTSYGAYDYNPVAPNTYQPPYPQ